jgi:hypothetical protein
MNNTSPEVLIYLQTVKTYLNNNEEAKNYFIGESDESFFYEHLTMISEKNFKTNGDPILNYDQFELLRKTLLAILITKKNIPEEPQNIFIELNNFGKICLN